ncbi:MAG: lysophospholipid acyltransferase family protein [Pirellulaceae bacterium]|nr:lysophospholipid acyltransferase family protein [Pirellulaceae bacterium]
MGDGKRYSRHGLLTDWLAYIALRIAVCGILCLSLESCDRLSRLLAVLISDWTTLRRQVCDRNLQLVYGSLDQQQLSFLRRKMWHHLLLMVCEIAHAPRKIHASNWREHIYMPDKEAMMRLLMDSRPTILVTGHFGNFEVAGYLTGLLGIRTSTIARPLDNPLVNEFVLDFRSGTGQTILPMEGSSTSVQQLLDNRGTLSILADQFAGNRGCWVEFFGHITSCHKSLALFVLSARAPMLVTYARRLDRPLRMEVGLTGIADPALESGQDSPEYLRSVEAMTRWYNDRLEQAIRLAPEQYWWLHRRWRDVPEAVRNRMAAKQKVG